MEFFEREITFTYTANVVPRRCRNAQEMRFQDTTTITVPKVTHEVAPVAFRIHKNVVLGNEPRLTELRWYAGDLWKRRVYRVTDQPDTPITVKEFADQLDSPYSGGYGNPFRCGWMDEPRDYPHLDLGRQAIVPNPKAPGAARMDETPYRSVTDLNRNERAIAIGHRMRACFLIIGDEVWECASEPRYVINTFGLGSNHGGTAMFVDSHYNPNIGADRYFRADQKETAIAEAERIALARGDTKSVPIRPHAEIDVLIPEAVRINPAKDHGDGDEFTNKVEGVIQGTGDPTAAGLFALGLLATEINKR